MLKTGFQSVLLATRIRVFHTSQRHVSLPQWRPSRIAHNSIGPGAAFQVLSKFCTAIFAYSYSNVNLRLQGINFPSTGLTSCRVGLIVSPATFLSFSYVSCVAPQVGLSDVWGFDFYPVCHFKRMILMSTTADPAKGLLHRSWRPWHTSSAGLSYLGGRLCWK